MMADAVLLSLALADRIRLGRLETEKAKADLLEATRSHARELEETVAHRTLELSAANASKDKFFSIIAHDLRAPIGGLALLFNDAIKSVADLTPETLGIVRTTTNNTRILLEELLTWARTQRNEIGFQPAIIDVGEVLSETQTLFEAPAQAKGVDLDLQIAPPCWVLADLAMVQMILRNLVGNALKFTAAGGTIRAAVSREHERCLIEVTDTGVGMDEKNLKRLFRLDKKPAAVPGTYNEQGAGLGLILCREFVEKNGGAIGVRSAPGQGSTFWFTLPKGENGAAGQN